MNPTLLSVAAFEHLCLAEAHRLQIPLGDGDQVRSSGCNPPPPKQGLGLQGMGDCSKKLSALHAGSHRHTSFLISGSMNPVNFLTNPMIKPNRHFGSRALKKYLQAPEAVETLKRELPRKLARFMTAARALRCCRRHDARSPRSQSLHRPGSQRKLPHLPAEWS